MLTISSDRNSVTKSFDRPTSDTPAATTSQQPKYSGAAGLLSAQPRNTNTPAAMIAIQRRKPAAPVGSMGDMAGLKTPADWTVVCTTPSGTNHATAPAANT